MQKKQQAHSRWMLCTRTRSWAGYLAIERAKTGKHKILGLDISKDFIEIARKNAKEAGVEVAFRPGDVIDIPFSNNVFGFIICTAAFKNLKEPFKALNQMYGVLRSDSYKNSSQNRVNFEGQIFDLDENCEYCQVHFTRVHTILYRIILH